MLDDLARHAARLFGRSRAYKAVFGRDDAATRRVLADLSKFCCAQTPTVRMDSDNRIDPLAMAVAEGRREVWNRINSALQLSESDIARYKDYDND